MIRIELVNDEQVKSFPQKHGLHEMRDESGPVQKRVSHLSPNHPYSMGRSQLSYDFHDPGFSGWHPAGSHCHP